LRVIINMREVRRPAVAGYFYPADPGELGEMLAHLLEDAPAGPPAKVLIAPHAGYVYSGPIAASAYARLTPVREHITQVVLLGPSHRVAFRGLARCNARAYETPLGHVPVDTDTAARLEDLAGVRLLDEAHAQEHSLEVHVPFLQTVLSEFHLTPLVVGETTPEEIARVLDTLWGDEETLIVVSSDLSHYLSYETAREVDQKTALAIEACSQSISPEQACGCRPINGLLHALAARRMSIHTIDLRNSGDTAGTRDRVVGYGAFAAA